MFALTHKFFERPRFEAFLHVGKRLSLMTALLFVGWCFGCAGECQGVGCDGEYVEVGICQTNNSQIFGVQYGDRTPDEDKIFVDAKYVCAPTHMMALTPAFSGQFECLDPQTPFEEWGSADWGVYLYVNFPPETCGCDKADKDCNLVLRAIFDNQVGVPKVGQEFDLTQARLLEQIKVPIAANTKYVITSGTIKFVAIQANRYSFTVNNLKLTESQDESGANKSDCYTPNSVSVERISIDCLPELEGIPINE